MDVEIKLGYEFTEQQKKDVNIASSDDLNGWYLYNLKKAVINVSSDDFKNRKTQGSFMRLFNRIVAHEVIHGVIHEITGSDNANFMEEKVVELMTGERRW